MFPDLDVFSTAVQYSTDSQTRVSVPLRVHLETNVIQRDCFWVKHYAGKVKYTIGGWVERNMDSIPQSFNDTLATSTLKVNVLYRGNKEGRYDT